MKSYYNSEKDQRKIIKHNIIHNTQHRQTGNWLIGRNEISKFIILVLMDIDINKKLIHKEDNNNNNSKRKKCATAVILTILI